MRRARLRAAVWALVWVAACSGAIETPAGPVAGGPAAPPRVASVEVVEGVRASGEWLFADDEVVVLVTLVNRTSRPVALAFDNTCVVTIRADWATGAGTVYDQREGKSRCRAARTPVDLAPGESRELRGSVGALNILGPTRERERYRIVGVLTLEGGHEVELDFGIVELRSPFAG